MRELVTVDYRGMFNDNVLPFVPENGVKVYESEQRLSYGQRDENNRRDGLGVNLLRSTHIINEGYETADHTKRVQLQIYKDNRLDFVYWKDKLRFSLIFTFLNNQLKIWEFHCR